VDVEPPIDSECEEEESVVDGTTGKKEMEELQLNMKNISNSGRAKSNISWGFYREIKHVPASVKTEKARWYYCTKCYSKESLVATGKEGVIAYNTSNTSAPIGITSI
jgi:hypothetical protein